MRALCADYNARFIVQFYHEGRARAHSRDGSVEQALAPSSARDETLSHRASSDERC